MHLDPDPSSLVKEGAAVMRLLPSIERALKRLGIAKLEEEGFNSWEVGLCDEKIYISHRPEMGSRIVLLRDGNAFQEDYRGDVPLTGIQNLAHSSEVLGCQHLAC